MKEEDDVMAKMCLEKDKFADDFMKEFSPLLTDFMVEECANQMMKEFDEGFNKMNGYNRIEEELYNKLMKKMSEKFAERVKC